MGEKKEALKKNNRMFFVTVTLSVVIIFAVFGSSFYFFSKRLIRTNLLLGEKYALEAADVVTMTLNENLHALEMTANSVDAMMEDSWTIDEISEYLFEESRGYARIIDQVFYGFYGCVAGYYIDTTGWDVPESYNPLERVWYKKAVANPGEVVLSSPYMDAQTKKMAVTASMCLSDGESVIAIDMLLDDIESITNDICQDNYRYCLILDQEGYVIADSALYSTQDLVMDNSNPAELKNVNEGALKESEKIVAGDNVYKKMRSNTYERIVPGEYETLEFLVNAILENDMLDFTVQIADSKYLAYSHNIPGGWKIILLEPNNVIYEPLSEVVGTSLLGFIVISAMVAYFCIKNNAKKNEATTYAAELQEALIQLKKDKQTQMELTYLSQTDLMTGIRNRMGGEQQIRELLKQEVEGMFILLDADKFKSINDTYGHGVGDKVIIAIAQALVESFRDEDVIMRLGGDEFVVFAKGIISDDGVSEVLDRFKRNLRGKEVPELGESKIGVSIGVTYNTKGHQKTFEELYKEADEMTYLSKKEEGFTFHIKK